MSDPTSNDIKTDIPIDLTQLDQLTTDNVVIVSLRTQLSVQKSRNLTVDILEKDLKQTT
jgi:hypothetical protein